MGILDSINTKLTEMGANARKRREASLADKDKPGAILSDAYEDFILELPIEVQEDIDRYKNIFKNSPEVIEKELDEIKDKGTSSYIKGDIFKDGSYDNVDDKDKLRFQEFNYIGKGSYDALNRKDEAGSIARKKVMNSKLTQVAIAPGVGLYTGVRGTAELLSSLSDFYLDTETLDNVQKALPELNLNDIYNPDEGGLAKFISIMTQYGTGFAVASKIGKKLIGKTLKTKLAQKAAASKFAQTRFGTGLTNVAKFGGYYALPAGVADTAVSATGQRTIGDFFGNEESKGRFFSPLARALAKTKSESLEGLTGKERAAAILRNKLKFGTEGVAFLGGLKLIPLTAKYVAVPAARGVTNKIIDPVLTGASKVVGSEKSGIPQSLRYISKLQDKAMDKLGIPDSDLWKFSEGVDGIKPLLLRTLDNITATLKSGGRFNVQTRNQLKDLASRDRGTKKDFDILMTDLDREMYKLAGLNSTDILFNEVTRTRALSHWEDVLNYFRGNIKINDLPKSLRKSSVITKSLIDKQSDLLQPILKSMNVKNELIKNAGKYFKQGYEIMQNPRFRADKETYDGAINYFKKLLTVGNSQYKNVAKNSRLEKQLNLEAKEAVNRILQKGRDEGTTPAKRLETIVNIANSFKIPKTTFNKFFSKERSLPDEIGRLLGRVDDPKKIILDTIAEQAHMINSYNAYKEIADFGLGKFIFRNNEEFNKFLAKNNIKSRPALQAVQVSTKNNLNLNPLFQNKDGSQMLMLPEMVKALSDNTLIMDTLLKLPMMKSLLAIKAGVQMNKTVLSVMTQMRNITTAAMFASANGHIGVGASVADNFNFMFKDLVGKTKDPTALRKLLKEALDAGALDSSTIAQELEQMIPELMGKSGFGKFTTTQGKTSDQIFEYLFTRKGPVGKIVNKSIEAYQMGDNIWKLYGYQFVKSQLKPALRNIDDVKKYFREIEGYEFRPKKADGSVKKLDEAIQEIAGIEIRDTYPNYSMIPTAVQNIRKIPFLGNFVAFKSEMFRNSFQISRRSNRKLRSSNPYVRQIGARQTIGFVGTVFTAIPTAMMTAREVTGLSKEAYDAYMERFAADFNKGHSMMPITAQQKDHSWKHSDLNYLVPYADVTEPFKAAMQDLMNGKNTDQSTVDIYAKAAKTMMMSVLDTFIKPSIAAETALELTPNKNGQFLKKNGGLIADINNQDDWLNKVIAHGFSKITPTTIISVGRVADAIGGDLTKSGVKRDLFDEVLKIVSGFGISRANPYRDMQSNLGGYVGDLSRINKAFTGDVVNATKLQQDAELIKSGFKPDNINSAFEKKQSNSYRVLSEVYKDVDALRKLKFTEGEIRSIIRGRRALSDRDTNMVMLGVFNPDNLPNIKQFSGISNIIKNMNKELETNYNFTDFINIEQLNAIKQSYTAIPLGLSKEDREQYLRTSLIRKIEDVIEPRIGDMEKLLEEQKPLEDQRIRELENRNQSQLIKPQTPAAANIPMPDATMTAGMTANVNPMTRLTRTETALLSPEEQVIAQNRRGGIGSLI